MSLKNCLLIMISILVIIPRWVTAHPLAPSLLDIRETSHGQARVLWKIPASRAGGGNDEPSFPSHCRSVSNPRTSFQGNALIKTWEIRCSQGLVGSTLGVEGTGSSKVPVLLRVRLADGRVLNQVLSVKNASWTIPPKAEPGRIAKNYVVLGLEHILEGLDHLFFVLGLVLWVGIRRQLFWTVTAFTVGHSITLSLAVMDWIRIPQAPMEVLIASSILFLAYEILRPIPDVPGLMQKRPWLLSGFFGLFHGLGFAGALMEVGLPPSEIPLALFSFNLGIELGQLFFVLPVLLIGSFFRSAFLEKKQAVRTLAAYAMGSLAAFWCLERVLSIF